MCFNRNIIVQNADTIINTHLNAFVGLPILRGLSRLMTPISEDPLAKFTTDPHWYDAGDLLRFRSVPRL